MKTLFLAVLIAPAQADPYGLKLESYREWRLDTRVPVAPINVDSKVAPLLYRLSFKADDESAPELYSKLLCPSVRSPYQLFALRSEKGAMKNAQDYASRIRPDMDEIPNPFSNVFTVRGITWRVF